jgi:hypothetical protein
LQVYLFTSAATLHGDQQVFKSLVSTSKYSVFFSHYANVHTRLLIIAVDQIKFNIAVNSQNIQVLLNLETKKHVGEINAWTERTKNDISCQNVKIVPEIWINQH